MKKVSPLLMSFGLALGLAALRADSLMAETVQASTTPAVAAEVKTEPEYIYQAERFRDPFVPLAGQGALQVALLPQEEQVFKAGEMELKGIIGSRTGRMALLRSNGGTIYVVKDGKILDSKRKVIKGFVGIVKEKTLVVIGPNNQVTELKLAKDADTKASAAQ